MKRFAALCLALLAVLPASAQVPADLADTYLEASGLGDRVETVGEQIVQQIQAQTAQFPEAARAPFQELYADALGADALEARTQTYVANEAQADSLRAAVLWYEDPLVGRMQALEDSSSEDSNAQVAVQMYAMTGSFASTPVSPEREAQMDRFLIASGGSEAAVALFLDIIVASQQATAALSDEAPPPADSIRARMRPMLEANIGNAVRGSALYAYRDVADADFDAFVTLLETPAAQYASRLNREAMSAALVGAITDAGATFAQTLLELDAAGEIDLDAMRADG